MLIKICSCDRKRYLMVVKSVEEFSVKGMWKCCTTYLPYLVIRPCGFCGLSITVKHIVLDCINFQETHQKYYAIFSLRELFESVDNHTIIDFIKETHCYCKL